MFSIVCKGRNMYHLSVLESLFIKTNKPSLCKQKFVYNFKLFKTYCIFVSKFRFCC